MTTKNVQERLTELEFENLHLRALLLQQTEVLADHERRIVALEGQAVDDSEPDPFGVPWSPENDESTDEEADELRREANRQAREGDGTAQ